MQPVPMNRGGIGQVIPDVYLNGAVSTEQQGWRQKSPIRSKGGGGMSRIENVGSGLQIQVQDGAGQGVRNTQGVLGRGLLGP